MKIDLVCGTIELDIPSGVHQIFDSSIHLANLIDIMPGERVLDLGCGSGILSIAAAKKGAFRVVSTDIDRKALDTTLLNASFNGCSDIITTVYGTWYEPLKKNQNEDVGTRFDMIIATPPQTPGPYDFGPRYGGNDGTRHFSDIIEGAPQFLEPVDGRLWLIAISLADVTSVMEILKRYFQIVHVVDETRRLFAPSEYEKMGQGIFEHLCAQRAIGRCEFLSDGSGGYYFKTFYIRASGPYFR